MNPLVLMALVSTLCVAGIGAIYFVWLRKPAQPKQPAQAAQPEPK